MKVLKRKEPKKFNIKCKCKYCKSKLLIEANDCQIFISPYVINTSTCYFTCPICRLKKYLNKRECDKYLAYKNYLERKNSIKEVEE